METIASATPAAPIICPVMDFVELMYSLWAFRPKTRLTARVSIASFTGVPVPCAFIYTCSGGILKASPSSMACSTARELETASGWGKVT